MFQSTIILVLLAPFLVQAGDSALRDGPCPAPPPAAQNLKVNELTGRWLAVSSNYEQVTDPKLIRECLEAKVVKDGDDVVITSYYKDPSSSNNVLEKRYKQIAGQPQYAAYKLRADGKYTPHGWVYTIVKIEKDVILEYACKNEEKKHRRFYRIFARSVPISQDIANSLKQEIIKNADNRPLVPYSQENCQYKS